MFSYILFTSFLSLTYDGLGLLSILELSAILLIIGLLLKFVCSIVMLFVLLFVNFLTSFSKDIYPIFKTLFVNSIDDLILSNLLN